MMPKKTGGYLKKKVCLGLLFCFIFLSQGTPGHGKDRDVLFQTPGPRQLVMITERAVDYFQFRQDLSLTDEQMLSLREILKLVRRDLIRQDSFLRIETDLLNDFFLGPIPDEKDLLEQLDVVEEMIKSQTEIWIQGFEELQAVLNQEQVLTYAFIKGVPPPVMEFSHGVLARIGRLIMEHHGVFYLERQKELGLMEKQVHRLDALNLRYLREMVGQASTIEAGQLEVQDFISEPAINFDLLRKKVLETQRGEFIFFSRIVAYLVKSQDLLTKQQLESLVQLWDQDKGPSM